MSDTYKLQGNWSASPNSSPASGCPTIVAVFDETVVLGKKVVSDILLNVDTPVVVNFGGLTNAHVVTIKTDRKIRARFTSSDGTDQSVPIEGFFNLITKGSVPITAIDLTRIAGQDTNVKIFIGEKA